MAEVTNLLAIDKAFGNLLAKCEWHSDSKGMSEFISRKADEKIYRVHESDPEKALKKVAASQQTNAEKLKKPLILYRRELGISPVAEDIYGEFLVKGNNKGFKIDAWNYSVNYTVSIFSTEIPTIHEIALPLQKHLNDNRTSEIKFKYARNSNDKTNFFEIEGARAMIMNPMGVPLEDITVRKDRYVTLNLGGSFTFEVKTPIFFLEEAEILEYEYEFSDLKLL